MAEFGVAAGAIGAVSLTVQIADSLRKAVDFWESVKDGPDDIKHLSAELQGLANILAFIEYESKKEHIPEWQEQLVTKCLMSVKRDVDNLASLISKLGLKTGGSSNRRQLYWGQVKIALKGTELAKLRGYIRNSMDMLNILQTSRNQFAISQFVGKFDVLATNLEAYRPTQAASLLLSEVPINTNAVATHSYIDSRPLTQPDRSVESRTNWRLLDVGLGVLSFRSISTNCPQQQKKVEGVKKKINLPRKSYVMSFLLGFGSCRKGFEFRVNDTFDMFSLNSIRRVPDDSPIFQSCRNGDLQNVKELVYNGTASAFDINSKGRSPLHYACRFAHADLCRYLIRDLNADVYFTDNAKLTPAHTLKNHVSKFRSDEADIDRVAQTFDALMRHGQFDPLSFGWPDVPKKHNQSIFWIATTESKVIFIYSNLITDLSLTDLPLSDASQTVEYLCDQYLSLRRQFPNDSVWYEKFSLLFIYSTLCIGLIENGLEKRQIIAGGVSSVIIRRCYDDLHRVFFGELTALGLWLFFAPDFVPIWIQMLTENGVNLHIYGQREQECYRNKLVRLCPCHLYEMKIVFGATENDLKIHALAQRNSLFAHLDPEYLCKGPHLRSKCLCKVDSALVGSDGKPIESIPGAWEARARPNSELIWARDFWGRVQGVNSWAELPDGRAYEVIDYASL